MRRLGTIALAIGLVCGGSLRADDAKDARAIIEKAIPAAGGAEKIEKQKAMTWQEKGTYYGMGDGLPFMASYAIQMPDKFRMEIPNLFTIVVNGDKGWVKGGNGETQDMTADQLKPHHESLYAGEVERLVPVLKDKSFTLSLLGESKVGDKSVVGVKVAKQGRPDVNLFFDKRSNLLLRMEYTTHSTELGGKEVTQELLFSDFKDVDGVQHPMKVLINRDGKKYVEAELSDLKYVEKLDDRDFAKP
jgi:hypothetical protein